MHNFKKFFICSTLTFFMCTPVMGEIDALFTVKSDLDAGIGYLQEGNYNNAISSLKKSINFKPDYAMSHLYLGYCYIKTGENTQAINEFEIAKKMAPDDMDIYAESCLGAGNAYLTLGETDVAISILKNGINKLKRYPNWLEKLNFNMGEIYYNNNQIDMAREHWNDAINTGFKTTGALYRYYETNKQAARLRCLEGQNYLKAGKYDLAIEVLTESVALDTSEVLYARLLQEATQKDKTQKEYEDIIRRINKAQKFLINGQYYNAFSEYRVIRNSKITLSPELWKTVGKIAQELRKKGYVINN